MQILKYKKLLLFVKFMLPKNYKIYVNKFYVFFLLYTMKVLFIFNSNSIIL